MVAAQLLGHFVSPVIECVDIDGIVRRINVDDVVQRIDVDALLDRVDWNRLLDRVDLNKHVQKIDFNTILQNVDVEEIVSRSNVSMIVAQSTTGIFTHVLDSLRSRLVMVDLFLLRMARFKLRDRQGILPPAPGRNPREDRASFVKGRMNKSIAVQGRFTGIFSKAVAVFIDVAFLTLFFAGLTIVIKLCWILFLKDSKEEAASKVDRDNLWVFVLYSAVWFLHFFLGVALTGQTLGMAIAGIKVVDRQTGSEEISAWQSFMRTIFLPLTLTFLPPLGAIGFCRRDGRMLHDLVAGTGLVYDWDARMAKMRAELSARARQTQLRAMSIDDVPAATTVLCTDSEATTYYESMDATHSNPC